MDTPTIAAYYREADPMKRKELLEQSASAGEEPEANAVRRELWDIRYKEPGDAGIGTRADGFLGLWMVMEFNKNAATKWFGAKSARKEITKNLKKLKFQEMQEKSDLHRELLYRECCHMVDTYMTLCATDRTYNTMVCGIISMNKEKSRRKLQNDIWETGILLPESLEMQDELGMIAKAAREVYELHFPGEGRAD